MKNQYVGDIGDYGKYGLLRFLAQQGIAIGVNWYLTENDKTGQGGDNSYLDREKDAKIDPAVFRTLESIVHNYGPKEKTVRMIQDAVLIPNAVYYDDELKLQNRAPEDRMMERRFWYNRSILQLRSAELIFADPDNGISYRVTARSKTGEKYIFPEEVAGYYYRGKDVVFYCHKGRRGLDAWEKVLQDVTAFIPQASVFELSFRGGPARSYIFVIHPEHEQHYQPILQEFCAGSWKARFSLNDKVYHAQADGNPQGKPDRRVIERFQKAYRTKIQKEQALREMPNAQIDNLINAAENVQAKIFYSSFKRDNEDLSRLNEMLITGTGFSAPVYGEILPERTVLQKNNDETVTVLLPEGENGG